MALTCEILAMWDNRALTRENLNFGQGAHAVPRAIQGRHGIQKRLQFRFLTLGQSRRVMRLADRTVWPVASAGKGEGGEGEGGRGRMGERARGRVIPTMNMSNIRMMAL